MIILDGLTSYITVPNWIVMLALEIATIIIEASIIAGYWKLREGKLRWYEVIGLVAVANIITAVMGLAVSGISESGIYLPSAVGNLFIAIVFSCIIVGLVMVFLIPKDKDSSVEQKEGDEV